MKIHLKNITPFLLILLWTVIVGFGYSRLIAFSDKINRQLAVKEAKSTFNADLSFRQWTSSLGGFYVLFKDNIQPNEYLSHIPLQNIKVSDDETLTLMNPAWALRSLNEFRMHEFQMDEEIAISHITSRDLLRPSNAPDSWENAILENFKIDNTPQSELTKIDNEDYLRYMEPIYANESCLKCHGDQGIEAGDIRGGISVSVGYSPYRSNQKSFTNSTGLSFLLIYLIGFAFIFISSRMILMRNMKVKDVNDQLSSEMEITKKINSKLLQEIKNRKKLESEKDKLQSQLNFKSKMDGLGQLAGGVAHEYNNLIHGIMLSSQLLQMNIKDIASDSDSKKYFDIIDISSTRASDLTKDLLKYSNKGKIVFSQVDIHELLNRCINIIQPTLSQEIELDINLSAATAIINGDATIIESAFINLIINSKQSISDSGKISIHTSNIYINKAYDDNFSFTVSPGNYCVISIADTGCGIKSDLINEIFNPFFTTKEPGKGTGLGLTTVYNAVSHHKGSIDVESFEKKGTTIKLFFPLDENNDIEKSDEEKPNTEIKIHQILFVDDDEINRELASIFLTDMGYDAIFADNGKTAITQFIEHKSEISLVILDMMMPIKNGLETAKELKELDPNCKLLLSSGYTENTIIDEASKHLFLGFIKKPYKIEEIKSIIHKVLENQSSFR